MTSKVQPAADYWTVDRENLGTRLCHFWWTEKQRAEWRNSFKNRAIFWMNNKAIIEFGFRRIWRILQISKGVIHLGLRLRWIMPFLICRILHILLNLIQKLLPPYFPILFNNPIRDYQRFSLSIYFIYTLNQELESLGGKFLLKLNHVIECQGNRPSCELRAVIKCTLAL